VKKEEKGKEKKRKRRKNKQSFKTISGISINK
jgi:hypothetical protein